jgi:teichuronic acid biosynthesis glycosyltransferase TuaC
MRGLIVVDKLPQRKYQFTRFMKKLLIITDMFPDRLNPVSGVFVKHQVDELAKRYTVRVIATYFPHQVRVETEHTADYLVTHLFFPYCRRIFLSTLITYRMFALPRIKALIAEWQPDLVHVHDCRYIPELINLQSCMQKSEVPWYLTVHNCTTRPDLIRSGVLRVFYQAGMNKAYRGWQHIFTVNEALKKLLNQYADPARISIIGNAIQPTPNIDKKLLEKYQMLLKPDCFKIISVGNLKREKGFDLLIRSVHDLRQRGHNVQLVIIGAGAEEKLLSLLISKLGLGNFACLAGSQDNALIRNVLPLFDAFALPSYCETFGIVYLEAMAAGLPVIGIKGQGIDGIVRHGENGLLAEPCDLKDLIVQLEFLIQNQAQAKAMAEHGRQLVEKRYQLSALVNRLAEVYEQ